MSLYFFTSMSEEEIQFMKCAALEALVSIALLSSNAQGLEHQRPLNLPDIYKIQFA